MAVRRLSRLVGEGPFLIDGLVAMAINSLASDAEGAMVHFGRPTRRQALQYRRELDALKPMADVTHRLDEGERMMMLDSMCDVGIHGPYSLITILNDIADDKPLRSPTFSYSDPIVSAILNYAVDWDAALKSINQHCDRHVAAGKLKDPRARWKAMKGYDQSLKRLVAPLYKWAIIIPLLPLGGDEGRRMAGRHLAGFGVVMLMPVMNAAINAQHRSATFDRRSSILFALAAYRIDRGVYPPQLAELVPQYLNKLPKDAFTEAEFRYQRTKDGFQLYSLGSNGVDDGGRGWDDDYESGEPVGDDWLLTVPPPKPKAKK